MTETDIRQGTSEALDTELDDDNDDDRMSHYVKREDILRSAVEGVPATALCGKTWFPSRDPEKYPACPKCVELMELLRSME
ncbi:MAG: DUF3039 domain-containing protein [Actinobacteria bacterium]|nr:DUF3039 domain-containing protein [Actinomycetota bacterium]MCA1721382.1 DUF3039 domain-containing protein [Actinomycetota bacterium]